MRLDVTQALRGNAPNELELGELVPEVWILRLAVVVESPLGLDLKPTDGGTQMFKVHMCVEEEVEIGGVGAWIRDEIGGQPAPLTTILSDTAGAMLSRMMALPKGSRWMARAMMRKLEYVRASMWKVSFLSVINKSGRRQTPSCIRATIQKVHTSTMTQHN